MGDLQWSMVGSTQALLAFQPEALRAADTATACCSRWDTNAVHEAETPVH